MRLPHRNGVVRRSLSHCFTTVTFRIGSPHPGTDQNPRVHLYTHEPLRPETYGARGRAGQWRGRSRARKLVQRRRGRIPPADSRQPVLIVGTGLGLSGSVIDPKQRRGARRRLIATARHLRHRIVTKDILVVQTRANMALALEPGGWQAAPPQKRRVMRSSMLWSGSSCPCSLRARSTRSSVSLLRTRDTA